MFFSFAYDTGFKFSLVSPWQVNKYSLAKEILMNIHNKQGNCNEYPQRLCLWINNRKLSQKYHQVKPFFLVFHLCFILLQVVEWILGPGEKLLASQTDIGDSFETAEILRKRFEELEIKCAVSTVIFPYEPRSEKTGLRGFRPGPTQTGLYSHRRWL